MKWKYFGAACVVGGYAAHAMGAPVPAILVGIGLAITWKIFSKRQEFDAR